MMECAAPLAAFSANPRSLKQNRRSTFDSKSARFGLRRRGKMGRSLMFDRDEP
jgi:hypothetical protein